MLIPVSITLTYHILVSLVWNDCVVWQWRQTCPRIPMIGRYTLFRASNKNFPPFLMKHCLSMHVYSKYSPHPHPQLYDIDLHWLSQGGGGGGGWESKKSVPVIRHSFWSSGWNFVCSWDFLVLQTWNWVSLVLCTIKGKNIFPIKILKFYSGFHLNIC